MNEDDFFDQQSVSSKIKASIVSEYFPDYANIIKKVNKPKAIRFIDLFAGPGKYKDGNHSTPLLIADKCKKDAYLKDNVRMIFNDKKYCSELENNFLTEFPDGTFAHKPFFRDRAVGEDPNISAFLKKDTHFRTKPNTVGVNEYPSLLFIDPWGYKGIETTVLAEFLKNWGNEIFLFLNTKRIHAAIENDKFEPLMHVLFPTNFEKVKNDRRYKLSVPQRLSMIIDYLGDEYESLTGGKVYYLAFKFQEEDSEGTSHYILHLTKGDRGFDLVKTIYNDFANVGTIFDGNNTYTFDVKQYGKEVVELFDLKAENIALLKEDIYSKYKGQKIDAEKLYECEHKKHHYGRSHYTEALRELHGEGRLISVFTDTIKHIKPVMLIKTCVLQFQ